MKIGVCPTSYVSFGI